VQHGWLSQPLLLLPYCWCLQDFSRTCS
jgi:hypothetical protein